MEKDIKDKRVETTLKFLFKEEIFTLKELEANDYFSKLKAPIMISGADLPNERIVYVFENQPMLKDWISRTKKEGIINDILNKLPKAQKQEHDDHKWAKQKISQKSKRILNELEALSERTGLPLSSKELQKLATIDAPLIEGPVFDPAFLFAGRNLGIPLLPLWSNLFLPDFNWFGWNDSISSIFIVSGVVALYEHHWWQGRSLWLFPHPELDIYNLDQFGFDDNVSSAIHLHL